MKTIAYNKNDIKVKKRAGDISKTGDSAHFCRVINLHNKWALSPFLLALFLLFSVNTAYPLPEGYQAENNSATFDTSTPNTLVINAQENAVINYNSFNIAENESVYFYQPSASSNVLNNVTGSQQSVIAGYLYANGNIFIVNPNGIVFDARANINVGSLVASTMNIDAQDFRNGQYVFQKINKDGQIVNQAVIRVNDGGFIALLAQTVKNEGMLEANQGTVVLAGGNKATLTFDSNKLIQIVVNEPVTSNPTGAEAAVINTGTIVADGGKVIITASAARSAFANAVNNEGMITAGKAVTNADGTIALLAPEGDIRNTGTMYASGDVEIKAEKGVIVQSASAEVTGANVTYSSLLDTTLAGTIEATESVTVSTPANITIAGTITGLNGANLTFLADNDNANGGDFIQLADAAISTQDGGDIIIRSGTTPSSGTGNVTVADVSSSGDMDISAYGGEIIQLEGTKLAVTDGDLMVDAPKLTLYEIQAADGRILIGSRIAPVEIAGLPHYIHTAGNIEVNTVTTDANITTLNTTHGDILRYAATGDVTLEAPNGKVTNISGTAVPGDTVKLIGNQIGSIEMPFIVNANVTHIYRNIGDIDVVALIDLEGDQVTIVGPVEGFGAVTYCSLKSLTLEAQNGGVADSGQAIIPASTLTLIGNNIGHYAQPFITDADTLHVERTSKDIVIALSSIVGAGVTVRGPPDDDFAITYSLDTNLTLEARDGSITVATGVVIYSATSSINLETHEKYPITINGSIIAPEGTVRLWTCGLLDLRLADEIISKEGGFIYNTEDYVAVSWDYGATTNNWADANNWSGNVVPNTNAYQVTINYAAATVTTAAAYTIGELIIGTTNTCSLTLGGALTLDDADVDLDGDLTINANGTLATGGYTINIDGDFVNSGTFTNGSGIVNFTKPSSIQTVNPGLSALYRVNMTGAGTLQFAANTSMYSFNATAGILDFNAKTITTTAHFTIGTGAQILSDADAMNGTTLTIGSYANLLGQSGDLLTFNATATWYLRATSYVYMNYVDVEYCDASGYSRVDATENCTNSLNNTNFLFTAETRYWVGAATGATANWNTTASWSTSTGGATGASIPIGGTDVIFDGGGSKVGGCVINTTVVVGSITCTSGYTGAGTNDGHLNAATNDNNISVSRNVTFSNKQVSMGDGDWSVGGNFNFVSVTTFNGNASDLFLGGTGKTLTGTGSKYLKDVIITGSYSIGSYISANTGNLTVEGTLTTTGYYYRPMYGSSVYILEGGVVNGTGLLDFYRTTASYGLLQLGGTLDANVSLRSPQTNAIFVCGRYGGYLQIRSQEQAANFTAQAGTYTVLGAWSIQSNGYNLTIDNDTNDASYDVTGAVTVLQTTGTLTYTKGSGTITLNGASANFSTNGYSLEDVIINATGTKTMTSAAAVKSLTISAGTFAQSTYALTVTGNMSIASGASFTKSSNSSALTFDGTGNLSDGNGTLKDLGVVVIGGTTTTRTLTTGIKMTSLTINSDNRFTLAGNGFTFLASAAVTNNGYFRLQGGETLTNVSNLGTAAGTVEYVGAGGSSTYSIKDFGATDYFNLTINGAAAETFQVQDTYTLTIAGDLTLTQGILDNATYDENLTINGNTLINGGTMNTGTGVITFGDVGTDTVTISSGALNIESDVLATDIVITANTWTNSGGTITYKGSTGTLPTKITNYYDLVINSVGATFTVGTTTSVAHNLTVTAGTLKLSDTSLSVTGTTLIDASGIFYMYVDGGTPTLTIGNTLTNSGTFTLETRYGDSLYLTGSGGVRTFTGNNIDFNGASIYFTSIDYDPDLVLDETSDGVYLSDSNCLFDGISIGAGTTFSASSYNFTISGNFSNSATGVFTHTGGIATFNAVGAQTVNSGGDSFYSVTVANGTNLSISTNNLTIAGNLIVGGGVSGSFNTNSKYLTVTGTTNISAGAVFTLDGEADRCILTIGGTLTNYGTFTLGSNYDDLRIIGSGGVRIFTGNDIDYNGETVEFSSIDYDPDVSLDESGDGIHLISSNCSFDGISIGAGTTFSASSYNFTISGNFSNSATGVFTHTGGIATFNAVGAQTVASGGDPFYSITVSDGTNLSISTNDLTVAGNLIVGGGTSGSFDTNSKNLNVTGTTLINSNATFRLDGKTAVSTLTIGNTLTNNGTFILDDSAVCITGSGGVRAFTGNGIDYYGQTVTLTSIDYDPDVLLDAEGDTMILGDSNCSFNSISIGVGGVVSTFNAGTYSFTISGDFSNTATGVFTHTGGTATFDADRSKTITSSGDSFYNITFNNASGTWATQDSLTVTNDLTITAGTLNMTGYGLSVGSTTAIDPSGSSSGTLNSSQRRSFYDTVNSKYWVFYYTGSAIEYAYSANGTTWTTSSTLAYNTTNFSVAYKSISATGYAFVAADVSNDVTITRGTCAATSIDFSGGAITVFNGTSSSDSYSKPTIALDSSNYVWIGARHYEQSYYYQADVRRSTNVATGDLSAWGTTTAVGGHSSTLTSIVLVPGTSQAMNLIAAGESNNITHYAFNGSSWSSANTGGSYAWLTFPYDDLNGSVKAIAVIGTTIYVGGDFTTVGGLIVNRIAKYTPSTETWTALGSGTVGVSGSVLALAPVGTTALYVGGLFTEAGGTTVNNIALYTIATNAWSTLNNGVSVGTNGEVAAIKVVDSSNVYVGGSFTTAGGTTVNYIAKWNGSNTWSALGTGMNARVRSLDTISTDLYAGGDFTTAGGTTVNYIAKWNGSAWSALGVTGTNAPVYAVLAVGANLYAGGNFTTAGGSSANYVAMWNGTAWSALGTGMNAMVYSLTAIDASNVYAGGNFTTAGGTTVNYIAKWNGTAWSALNTGTVGTNARVRAMAVYDSNVYAGGDLTAAGGTTANYIAKYTPASSSWATLSTGTLGANNTIYAIAVLGTDIYVGGSFLTVGGVTVNRIAKYTPSTDTWYALSYNGNIGVTGTVRALAVINTDLYVGGNFYAAGGVTVNNIAMWDGSTWYALNSGTPGVGSAVYSLAVMSSQLYVGGLFTTAGGTSGFNRIARYAPGGTPGTGTWSTLGTGMNGYVNALAVLDNNLYAGGNFTTAGGTTVNYIAKWNGSSWSSLGAGGIAGSTNVMVNAIQSVGTSYIYIGGNFTSGGGVSANNIIKYTSATTEWAALGTGTNYAVRSLALIGSTLYAGGDFTTAGGTTVNRVAKWNGTSWSATNTGDNVGMSSGSVYALAVNGTELYAGGSFIRVKGLSSGYFAKYALVAAADTGTNPVSVVSDLLGNIHSLYIHQSGYLAYNRFNVATSSWGTATTIYSSGTISSPALSISSSDNTLYAFWVSSNTISGKSGSILTTNTKWDTTSTTLYSTGTNTNLTSMYEVNSLKTPLMWTKETDATYDVTAELVTGTAIGLSVGGDWSNAATFNSGSGTVTLNGTAAQTVTTGGSGSGFGSLTITNTNASGVTFNDALYTGALNAVTGDTKLYFAASPSIVHTVTDTFNIHGAASHLITLAPATASTTWYLNAPTGSSVSYVNVTYSSATNTITATNSTGSNNTNWTITP